MEIRLQGISKRFTGEWIFQDINRNFFSGKSYAITGPNGSGKSTLLMILSGWLLPTEGQVEYHNGTSTIDSNKIYQHIDFIAPYLELIEEFTLEEFVNFHFTFNELMDGMTGRDFIHEIFLDNDKNKFIRHFSSGMRQRLKLATGFYSRNPVLFLDEPTSNLDEKGRNWFFELFNKKNSQKLIILASNQTDEYKNCEIIVKITDYKVTYN